MAMENEDTPGKKGDITDISLAKIPCHLFICLTKIQISGWQSAAGSSNSRMEA